MRDVHVTMPVAFLQAARFANQNLATLYPSNPGVINDMWAAMDHVIQLKDCKVLVFNPENPDLHPYADALWKFVFLFYNPKLNRLLLFGCSSWSSTSPRKLDEDDDISISDGDEDPY